MPQSVPSVGITKVSVIVPAYNEAGTIADTLKQIVDYAGRKPYAFEVIVSADGNDGTREAARAVAEKQPGIRVIGNVERLGKGRGIREGVRLAEGDVIGFVDADNKTPITEFDKFEGPLGEGWDVVIGSRAMPGASIERRQPWHRRAGSKVFSFGMHAVIGLPGITDTQCGFKFFARAAALDIFSRQRIDGYMFDVEILVLAERSGYRIAQVPVRWRDDGDSRYGLVSGSIRNMVEIMRIRFGGS